jgi:hypothetical protein
MRIRPPFPSKLPENWHRGLSPLACCRILRIEAQGPRVLPTKHHTGYVRVWLSSGHPYANSGGWQYLHRYLMMRRLGRTLGTYEHVHHADDSPKDTTDIRHLEILEDVDHGLYHWGQRLGCGREFRSHSEAGKEPELDKHGKPEPYYHQH